MKQTQAKAEAKRRWGDGGLARKTSCSAAGFPRKTECRVGRWTATHPVYLGRGPTWEAAFADADLRAAPADEFRAWARGGAK